MNLEKTFTSVPTFPEEGERISMLQIGDKIKIVADPKEIEGNKLLLLKGPLTQEHWDTPSFKRYTTYEVTDIIKKEGDQDEIIAFEVTEVKIKNEKSRLKKIISIMDKIFPHRLVITKFDLERKFAKKVQ